MSLLGAAETYALLSVMTMTMFGQNPLGFVMPKRFGQSVVGNQAGQYWSGRGYVSLNEFWIDPNTAMSETWGNIKQNWGFGLLGMVGIPIGFRLGKKLARPAISRTNRLLGDVGLKGTVRL